MPEEKIPQVFLGFDFGMKRIGVAVGQAVTQSANPLTTLPATDGIPSWDAIKTLIDVWHAEAMVVGIPYNMDGTEQSITYAARQFAQELQSRFGLPVFHMDERLTTKEAKYLLIEKQSTHKVKFIDSLAAKLILESWLQAQQKKTKIP